MSAVLACIALRFQFKAQVGWNLLINISAFLARELVAGNAKRANPNDTELLSVMHRYNSALATAIAVFGHYAIERNERALFAAARARGIGREGGGGGASPGWEPPTSPSSKIEHHHQHASPSNRTVGSGRPPSSPDTSSHPRSARSPASSGPTSRPTRCSSRGVVPGA